MRLGLAAMRERWGVFRRDLKMLADQLAGRPPPSLVPRQPRNPSSRSVLATRTLRITDIVKETPAAVSLYLEEIDGGRLAFQPGQFLTLFVSVAGETHRRAYSLASPVLPGHPPHITIKRIQAGRVSNYLADHATPGSLLRVLGPSGDFTIATAPENSHPLVFIAGGSGITPIASILETVLAAEPARRVALIYGNRHEGDIIFRERLDLLHRQHPDRFTLDFVLETPSGDWSGGIGRLDEAVLARRLDALPNSRRVDAHYYLCGPSPMMEAARRILLARDVDPHRIREERFTHPEARAHQGSTNLEPQPVTVFALEDQREFVQTAGMTILESAQLASVDLPYSCGMGGCGACRVRLVSGTVHVDEPNALNDAEREEGFILTCVGRAATPITIEVPHG